MSGAYPLVPLGEIACPVSRPIAVVPGASYRTFGVKWWGEGAYERETIDGADTAAETLFLIREGDLVINKIWVRHGSVAIASREVDGCAASNEFPTFELNRAQVEPRWLHWLTKTRRFWEQCAALSFGTSGKNRIKPAQFLTVEVPLPSLGEQRRLVGRIEDVAGKVAAAKGLRQEAAGQTGLLTSRAIDRLLCGASAITVPLRDVLREDSRNGLSARPSESPPGKYILRISAATSRPDFTVDEEEFRYLDVDDAAVENYLVQPMDLLACRFNGNLHYVGRFALFLGYSGRAFVYPDKLIRFRANPDVALPQFLRIVMNSQAVRKHIEALCATTAGNIGISATDLKSVPVPLPSLAVQARIVACLDNLQQRVDALRRLQEQTTAELDALLPAVLERAFSGAL